MRGQPFTYLDFSGGVNFEAAPYLLQPNQARDCLNVRTNAEGQLRKRNGFSTFAALSGSPASFTAAPHTVFPVNLSTKLLLAVGKIGASDDRVVSISLGGTVTDLTPGALPYTADRRWHIAQAPVTSNTKGPIFAMNGTDTPQHWDGNTANDFADWTAASGSIPTGKYLTYHENRLWCTGGSAAPSRLRYSGITGTSPDTGNWDANNYVDLEPEDGEEITAIATFGTYLLVFKARKIFVITDTVTGQNRQLSEGVGCIAHRSCVETPQGLVFLDEEQGVMVTDGNVIERLSESIGPALRTAAGFPSSLRNAAAVYHDDSYFLSVSLDGNTNNRTFEYDFARQSWWPHDCAANDWALIDPLASPALYTANPNAINIQQAFVANLFADSGAAYTGGAYFTMAQFVWGEPHIQKRVRQVRAGGSGDWVLDYAKNWVDDFTTDSGETWTASDPDETLFAPSSPDGETFAPSSPSGDDFAPPSAAVIERRYYTLGFANAWSFRWRNTDSADFQLYSMTAATTGRTD